MQLIIYYIDGSSIKINNTFDIDILIVHYFIACYKMKIKKECSIKGNEFNYKNSKYCKIDYNKKNIDCEK